MGHYISDFGDERYPNNHCKCGKIPTLSSWGLWRLRRMDSGNWLPPAACDHSEGLWLLSRSTHQETRYCWQKQLFLSENKQLKFSALGGISFSLLFSLPSLFLLLFMKRLLIMRFYIVFEMRPAGVTKLKHRHDTSHLTWASFCLRQQCPSANCSDHLLHPRDCIFPYKMFNAILKSAVRMVLKDLALIAIIL